MSIAEAAEWCGVSEKTIRRAIAAGKPRARKIGALQRIRPADLEDFVDRGTPDDALIVLNRIKDLPVRRELFGVQ